MFKVNNKAVEQRLCQSLIFNKVAGLRPGTLLKKRLWLRRRSGVFITNFEHISSFFLVALLLTLNM